VYEEFIDKLKKRKEERQEDYDRLKGMIAGFRLTNFNQTEESLVLIVEYAMNSFKDHQDSIDALKEATIYSFQRLETLEKEMKKLRETSVRALEKKEKRRRRSRFILQYLVQGGNLINSHIDNIRFRVF